MKKDLVLKIQKEDEFIKDLAGKTYQELKEIVTNSMEGMILSTYDLLRSAYLIELTGGYKEDGYEDFESWLTHETFLTSYSQFRDFIKVAKRYSRMLVEKIGFQTLALIERLPLSENTKETLITKLEHDIETKNVKFSREQVITLAKPLTQRKEIQREASIMEILRTKLREAKKKIMELLNENRDLKEKLMKAEVKIDDQSRYIQELQRGERSV